MQHTGTFPFDMMTANLRPILSLSASELEAAIAAQGLPAYRSRQLERALWDPAVNSFDEVTVFPAELRERFENEYSWSSCAPEDVRSDDGAKTATVLTRLADGNTVETVVMAYREGRNRPRTSVCISSQVGCAVGCPFCATGRLGLMRQLTTAEIVDQVRLAQRVARENRLGDVTHVVFMGMGEPLANTGAVLPAISSLVERFRLSARRITVSTSGHVPGIDKLAEAKIPVTLAVSLHAATDALRNTLVPLSAKYPLRQVLDAADRYAKASGRRITYEWCLIEGVNDSPEQASGLRNLAREHRAHVNVIPMNRIDGSPWNGPPPQGVKAFIGMLAGVRATVRNTRGQQTDAACGQLRATYEARRRQLEDGTLSKPVKSG